MERAIAEGAPKQTKQWHAKMLARLRTAPDGLRQLVIDSPAKRYFPAGLLTLTLTEKTYTDQDRRAGKILYKWRRGIPQEIVEWGAS